MTNESLDSATTGTTKFCAMNDRNGNSLNINSMDTVTISFVKEGKTYSATAAATDNLNKLIENANSKNANTFKTTIGSTSYIGKDIAGDTVHTADEKQALTIEASGTGVKSTRQTRSRL